MRRARSGQPFLYVNCDELALRDSLKSPAVFARALDDLLPQGAAVFFEEVQRLPASSSTLRKAAGLRTWNLSEASRITKDSTSPDGKASDQPCASG
jgi:hypothetical protein